MRKIKHSRKTQGKHTAQTKKTPAKWEQLYGILPVLHALKAQKRVFRHLWVKEGKTSDRLQQCITEAQKQQIPLTFVAKKELDVQCPGALHQGLILECGSLAYSQTEPWKKPEQNRVLVALDQIEDPHNLGAIIRSCAFFEVGGLILPKDHAIGITPVVSKASAGTAEFFPVITVSNLSRFLKQQQEQGYWVVGLEGTAQQSLKELQQDRPLILVLGNEGRGLRSLTQKNCDWLLHIPGNPQVASLNVSNAAAISLFHLCSQETP